MLVSVEVNIVEALMQLSFYCVFREVHIDSKYQRMEFLSIIA